ncbi:MAG: hypothetical protein ABW250_23260 [Pyrinomonadaceae bacterium]
MKTHNRRTLIRGVRLLLLPLLLFSASARAAAGRQAVPKLDWREFTSEAGGFTVKFPGAPRLSNPKMTLGPFTLTRHVHEVSVGDYSFEMDYVEIPAGGNADYGREGGIRGFIDRALAAGGRVLSDGKVSRGTCEGREASVLVPSGAGASRFKHARSFFSGQRLYLLFFIAGKDRPEAREAALLFMDSFVVRDGCAGSATPAAAPKAEPVRSTIEGRRDEATGWRLIESAEHGFSVLMPGAARLESRQTQVGNLPLYFHQYVRESDGAIYEVKLQGDFPKDFYEDDASLEGLLDLSLYVLKKNLEPQGFSFTEARRFKTGPHPGRDYDMTNERARGRARLYATPRRAYLFIVRDRGPSPAADADLERFFSSIKLSPK